MAAPPIFFIAWPAVARGPQYHVSCVLALVALGLAVVSRGPGLVRLPTRGRPPTAPRGRDCAGDHVLHRRAWAATPRRGPHPRLGRRKAPRWCGPGWSAKERRLRWYGAVLYYFAACSRASRSICPMANFRVAQHLLSGGAIIVAGYLSALAARAAAGGPVRGRDGGAARLHPRRQRLSRLPRQPRALALGFACLAFHGRVFSAENAALTIYWSLLAAACSLAWACARGNLLIASSASACCSWPGCKALLFDVMPHPFPFHFFLNTRLLTGFAVALVMAYAAWELSRREVTRVANGNAPAPAHHAPTCSPSIYFSCDVWQEAEALAPQRRH